MPRGAPDPATNVAAGLISLVVPVYNEEANVEALLARLEPARAALGAPSEVIFVDDGSRDRTAELLDRHASQRSDMRVLRLARNFGHQAALYAGMDHARGEAVVTLDGDLQHPPELIPRLVQAWRDGADVVQTIRREPADDNALKRGTSRVFYRVLSLLASVRVTPGAADFRLLSREALDAFLACRERSRFNRGLVQWIGFEYREIAYDAEPRFAGRSKYSWRSMARLAGDAIFSFSTWPLRFAGLLGACVSLAAAGYLLFVLWAALFTRLTQPGWSSILAAVLGLGGMQLLVLWIIGEYLGRLYDEAKQRPIYIVRTRRGATPGAASRFRADRPAAAPAAAPSAGAEPEPNVTQASAQR
ncbi:MAG: putative glycosyltransferase [Phycisphaerae bacterium]|nr:putative glycosyltransferase [Phycisphaerae bacterium]